MKIKVYVVVIYQDKGDDAMPDILRLKEVAEDLALFWGYEELEGMFAESLGKILK